MATLSGPLAPSADGRYLVDRTGTPFFWLADTAWELFHRLDLDEATHYLETRKNQGFNVIQAVALAELDGIRTPNRNGDLPFGNDDPARPVEAYWAHVDRVMTLAEERGLIVALLPTWGDKVFRMWGAGPVIFDEAKALAYGRWLGARYASRTNVVWVLGGDRPIEGHETVYEAMARGLHESARFLTTLHPMGGRSSSEELHAADWLDFHMLQTGHGVGTERVQRMIQRGYRRTPIKPILDGEPIYEEHPVGFSHRNGGISDDYDVRTHLSASVFAGGCGVTYGCHAVWQFAQDRYPGVNRPIGHWKDALTIAGGRSIHRLKDLAIELGLVTWAPDETVLLDAYAHPARVSSDGRTAAVHVTDAQGGVELGRGWRDATAEWRDLGGNTTIAAVRDGIRVSPEKREWPLRAAVLILRR